MQGPSARARGLEAWEDALQRVLSSVDRALEEKHGARWPLHPARPPAGTAANPQYDGLFRVTASFSAGYGSSLGPGYVLRAEPATLAHVPREDRDAIEAEAAALVREGLAREFPGRSLSVDRDGPVWKIHGDLSLGGDPAPSPGGNSVAIDCNRMQSTAIEDSRLQSNAAECNRLQSDFPLTTSNKTP